MFPNHHGPEGKPQTGPSRRRDQNQKNLPCRFCTRRFRRVEHVQRHERTHTKEKPFPCNWHGCGKRFARRDLLNRHEKLVHLNEGANRESGRQKKSLSSRTSSQSDGSSAARPRTLPFAVPDPRPQQPLGPHHLQQQYHHHLYPFHHSPHNQALYHHSPSDPAAGPPPIVQDARDSPKSGAGNLELLSDAALGEPPAAIMKPRDEESPPFYPPQAAYDVSSPLREELSTAPQIASSQFREDHRTAAWSGLPESPPSSLSLGSLDPDVYEPGDGRRRVSLLDYASIKNRIDEYSAVLPSDFVFPSRHTLSRFLDGYIFGFHEQLPMLHLPTLALAELSPELLLAILALGAQCRFESNRGYALWYAAKAIVMEQIRRRQSSDVHALLPTAAAYSPHSTRPSPSTTYRHSFASAQSERPMTQDTHQTIQAALLLFAVGLWGAKTIICDALSLQGTLNMLIREEGLMDKTDPALVTDWDAWVRLEGANRTRLVAYCLFTLCTVTYDSSPQLLATELNVHLPLRARLWRAESSWQWQELRQSTPAANMTTYEAVLRLFSRHRVRLTRERLSENLSSFGYYVLLHMMLQNIYLIGHLSTPFTDLPFETRRRLQSDDADAMMETLQFWRASFDHRRQLRAAETGYPGNAEMAGGSLAHNMTAMVRLVYLRIQADVAPGWTLQTRDSKFVATVLSNRSSPPRGPRLIRAVNHAVHALSTLVKAGVGYVARAKSEWGMLSSLCNLECAVLLAKWLLALSDRGQSDPPVFAEEKRMLELVRVMLDETEFAVPIDPSLLETATSDKDKLRQLASAVLRVWAVMFKATDTFDLIRVFGASLDGYADAVDSRTETGRGEGQDGAKA
ncbi:hypothetical protein CP533_4534 [Ophiocordyceps camponoti-saundersi (nom. inval.)]|nr:hypothetical protein CP533_4534 [Ophiocordyceps camponoti-saundersi (nom. inval.)]